MLFHEEKTTTKTKKKTSSTKVVIETNVQFYLNFQIIKQNIRHVTAAKHSTNYREHPKFEMLNLLAKRCVCAGHLLI